MGPGNPLCLFLASSLDRQGPSYQLERVSSLHLHLRRTPLTPPRTRISLYAPASFLRCPPVPTSLPIECFLLPRPPFFLEHALREGAPIAGISTFANLSQTLVSTPPQRGCASKEAEKSEQTLHPAPSSPSQEWSSGWGLLSGPSAFTRRIAGPEAEGQCGVYFHPCSRLHPHPP